MKELDKKVSGGCGVGREWAGGGSEMWGACFFTDSEKFVPREWNFIVGDIVDKLEEY